MLIVQLFVSSAHVSLFHFFLFLLVAGVGCDMCLWLFLDFCLPFLFKRCCSVYDSIKTLFSTLGTCNAILIIENT